MTGLGWKSSLSLAVHLLSSARNWIEEVDTKSSIYMAGSGTQNHRKAFHMNWKILLLLSIYLNQVVVGLNGWPTLVFRGRGDGGLSLLRGPLPALHPSRLRRAPTYLTYSNQTPVVTSTTSNRFLFPSTPTLFLFPHPTPLTSTDHLRAFSTQRVSPSSQF